MRISILLSPAVPLHLREALQRNGLHVVRLGAGFRVEVAGTLLGPQEATVRIDVDGSPPEEGSPSRLEQPRSVPETPAPAAGFGRRE
jgi:hypothetical protein